MSQFDSLVAELTGKVEVMAKAMPTVDPEPDADADLDPPADETAAADAKDKDGKEMPMGKAMKVTIDGVETDAVDAGPLLKALGDRLDGTEATMVKALGGVVDLLKSLTEKVNAIGSAGKGRKAIVTVHDRKVDEPLAKSDSISPEAFMGKAMDCFTAGKLTGTDISTIENLLHKRQPVPQAYIDVVAGHSA